MQGHKMRSFCDFRLALKPARPSRVCRPPPAARRPPPAARRPLQGQAGGGTKSHKMTPFCDTAFLDGIRMVYHAGKLQL